MKKFKIMSLFMAILMAASIFTGCGNSENKPDATATNGATVNSGEATATPGEQDTPKEPETLKDHKFTAFPEALTAKKIGKINTGWIQPTAGGVIYQSEDGKYGIMTHDGKSDTGAKYTYCDNLGIFFLVSNVARSGNDVASLNCYGVVDVKGKEIAPMQYAAATALSERYIYVAEAKGETDYKDEELIYTGSTYDNTYKMYHGVWHIIDAVTGKAVEGVTGTKKTTFTICGNFISYSDKDNKKFVVNDKGKSLPEDVELFPNGYYSLVKNNAGGVYDSDNNLVFSYSMTDYIPFYVSGDYLIGTKYTDSHKYVLMDMTGKVVSAEFDEQLRVYGEVIMTTDYKLYDFSGKSIVEGKISGVLTDTMTKNAFYVVLDNDERCIIKKDGTILWEKGTDEDIVSSTGDFYSYKKVDGDYMYYSFKDKDYTIKGFVPTYIDYLVESKGVNRINDVIDTISGETIISGYSDYTYEVIEGSGAYVYAMMADGGVDIYEVK